MEQLPAPRTYSSDEMENEYIYILSGREHSMILVFEGLDVTK